MQICKENIFSMGGRGPDQKGESSPFFFFFEWELPLGLSKELKYLHPFIHVHIIQKLMTKHKNLHADLSWDVLAKQFFMNCMMNVLMS